MKKLWTALSIVSLANLLAMSALALWLVNSDRLNMDRVRQARVVLAKTITQEKSEADAAAAKAAEDQRAAEAARIAARPPLTAAERLAARVEATEMDLQRAERLKREVQDMQRQLTDERAKLTADKEKLAADRKTFEEMIAANTAATTDGQFQKTLAVMESLKPPQAIAMLKEMMPEAAAAAPAADPNAGLAAGGAATVAAPTRDMTKAVSYLDAMDEKHRGAIMKELAKTEPKLAAELLERIRKQGEFARVP
jgi:hypothetical protein